MTSPTPYIPVLCRCPVCKLVFVEWELTTEALQHPPNLYRRIKCDICYAPLATGVDRLEIIRLCLKRRRDMHRAYWKECEKTYLDVYHRELLKRGEDVYVAHKDYDNVWQRLLASQSIPDKTNERIPHLTVQVPKQDSDCDRTDSVAPSDGPPF